MTPSSLPRSVRWAVALWILLAVVVFNVTFDWETRMSAHAFVGEQLTRQQQGQPPITINDGFSPMVRAAARHSAVWLVAISAVGITAIMVSGRNGIRAVPSERSQVR
jgi:hypothetical protein